MSSNVPTDVLATVHDAIASSTTTPANGNGTANVCCATCTISTATAKTSRNGINGSTSASSGGMHCAMPAYVLAAMRSAIFFTSTSTASTSSPNGTTIMRAMPTVCDDSTRDAPSTSPTTTCTSHAAANDASNSPKLPTCLYAAVCDEFTHATTSSASTLSILFGATTTADTASASSTSTDAILPAFLSTAGDATAADPFLPLNAYCTAVCAPDVPPAILQPLQPLAAPQMIVPIPPPVPPPIPPSPPVVLAQPMPMIPPQLPLPGIPAAPPAVTFCFSLPVAGGLPLQPPIMPLVPPPPFAFQPPPPPPVMVPPPPPPFAGNCVCPPGYVPCSAHMCCLRRRNRTPNSGKKADRVNADDKRMRLSGRKSNDFKNVTDVPTFLITRKSKERVKKDQQDMINPKVELFYLVDGA
uniref:Vegetative cell wall protein gp1 n=1 Tax=Globodera pallida TaxID=36090 RepID=A0A183CLX2_GLOPA